VLPFSAKQSAWFRSLVAVAAMMQDNASLIALAIWINGIMEAC
jgi:hypothetical protein